MICVNEKARDAVIRVALDEAGLVACGGYISTEGPRAHLVLLRTSKRFWYIKVQEATKAKGGGCLGGGGLVRGL